MKKTHYAIVNGEVCRKFSRPVNLTLLSGKWPKATWFQDRLGLSLMNKAFHLRQAGGTREISILENY